MKQETLDQLARLRHFEQASRTWWATYREAIRKSTCDKYQACFNGDDRFVVFKLKNLSFCAVTGYYGSSSCSTFGALNNALAEKYLPKALTALAPQIFEKMADLARADANKLSDEAAKELEALTALVKAATEEPQLERQEQMK